MGLIAETDNSLVAVVILISGLIGGSVTWFATWLSTRHDKDRKEKKEDEKTIIDHLKEVEERCNQENRELKADIKHTNKRLLIVMNHLMYLEGILEVKGIKFRRLEMSNDESITDDNVVIQHGPKQGLSKPIPHIDDDSQSSPGSNRPNREVES